MECGYIREKISLYIDSELSQEEKNEFENHIKECKECYNEYLSLLEVAERLNSIEDLPLPEGFREDLRLKLENIHKENKKPKRFKGFAKWTGVAAILLVGVVISSIFIGQFSPFNNGFLMGSRSSMDNAASDSDGFISNEERGVVDSAQPGSSPAMGQDGVAEREEEFAQEAQDHQEAQEDGGSPSLSNENIQEKIIYSAIMTLQVRDYDVAFEGILEYVKGIDGFIQSSSTNNPQYNLSRDGDQTIKEGHLFIRVPSDHFEQALDVIGQKGNLINNHISGDNISSQYRDIEVELNNLEIQEERIVEIMKSADRVEDILEIEKELNRIRTEINMRKSTLKNWDQLVDYSSIEINIREERIATSNIQGSPFDDIGLKIQKGFIQSINIIVEGIAKLILLLARAIPFIIILIAIIIIYKKWLWDKIKRK